MTNRIHGGDVEKMGKKLGLSKEELIDFSANINPLGPSSKAVGKIKESLWQIINYPDPECWELREALKKFYPLNNENLIFGNGASELIFILMKVLQPCNVLIPAPTFIEYQFAAMSVGSEVHFLKLNKEDEFSFPLEQLKKQAVKNDVLFLCNPNNPTGTLWDREQVREIVDIAQRNNLFMVLDEAFMDFLKDEKKYSFLFEKEYLDNVFILRSMTKFFAIPGLRLGWGVGPGEIIKKMHLAKDPWNVNSLAQTAGKESLLDEEYIQKSRKYVDIEKEYLYQELKKIKGLKPYCPSVNYIFVQLTQKNLTSGGLRETLAQKGVLIRDCSNYPNLDSHFIRVAVRKREENRNLVRALQEVISQG
ncbi:threonine-phosphate decarboxylase CobD [Candidatus Contubernalis alkaliaceticus]|uniref:threonine-phosphate decarboxylase CobD n=1 Tax=Candidatus Contubernalis alkaliaceticus TaxID=338645 RepID=UPI001F4C09B6|nr:threonine-phosphate decarboxylase CobD [Candidatus Contubernalis alkalaceticus]UNC92488.1 threonine-phosphate decarboxylase [Candidatus Contubernalis alkalaceticus]